MATSEAYRAVFGCWIPLFRTGLTNNLFYAVGSGLDNPGENTSFLISSFAKTGLLLGLFGIADLLLTPFLGRLPLLRPLLGAVLFFFLVFNRDLVDWQNIGRPLPLVTLAILIVVLWLFFKRKHNCAFAAPFMTLSVWAIFSLALLAKIGLNARLYHYGFYLAMPSALTFIYTVLWLIPESFSSKPGRGILFKHLARAVVAAGIVYHLQWSNGFYQAKNYYLAQGGDAIRTYGEEMVPIGAALNDALDLIRSETKSDDTLVVLPEGAVVNYLSRRKNPTPYINFLPPEMFYFGEQIMLQSLKASKPELIVLIHRDTTEFGFGHFGADLQYGKQILDWIHSDYAQIELLGAEPFQDRRFGIKILRRRPNG